MTTPPGSAGEDQLQNVVTTLLEDRRAMQANIEALMRTVEENEQPGQESQLSLLRDQ